MGGNDGNNTSSAVNTATANKELQTNTTNGSATVQGGYNDPDTTSTSTKSNDGDTVASSATVVSIPAPTTTLTPQKGTITDAKPPNSSSSVSAKTQPISSLFPTSTQTPSSSSSAAETKSSQKGKDKPNSNNNNNNSSQASWMNMNRTTTAGSTIFDTVRTNVVSNVVSLSTKARELPNLVAASTVVTGGTSSNSNFRPSSSNTTVGVTKKK